MKWKSDSIEQFIQYKIQHPEQSYTEVKKYQESKKHNKQLNELYKVLNKQRLDLNFFKSQQYRMNETVFRQVVDNIQQGKIIDSRCQQLQAKIVQLNKQKLIPLQQRPRSLKAAQYEQEINQMKQQIISKKALFQAQVQLLRYKIDTIKSQTSQQQLQQKIKDKQALIKNRKQLNSTKLQKYSRIEGLILQKSKIQEKNQKIVQQLNNKRLAKLNLGQTIKQTKIQEFKKFHSRLRNFIKQISQILVDSKIIPSKQKINEFIKKQIQFYQNDKNESLSNSQKRNNNQDINMWFTKKKDSNNIQFQDNLAQIDKNKQNLIAFLGDVQKLKSYIKQKLKSINIGQINEQQNENIIAQSKQQSQNYVKSIYQFSEIQPVTKLQFEIQLNLIKSSTQAIKSQQALVHQQQLKVLQKQQISLNKKQGELDKQIQQLQNRVVKTQVQIRKKTRKTY